MPIGSPCARPLAPARSRLRILLVEDEATIAVTLRDDLADHGHDVTVLADGRSALAHLALARFDAVISDLRLPGGCGLDVLRAARGGQPGARLLLITAWSTGLHERALQALGGALLVKPFDNDAVLTWLRSALPN